MQPLATFIFTVGASVFALILADKLKAPSILFLLLFGIALGPEFTGLIQPKIFQSNFPHYISLIVALILFEGGSSLKFFQLKEISVTLKKLLSLGVFITIVGVTMAAHWIALMSWRKAVLFASIMVVTGPTVVIPILRRIKIQPKIHNLLKWEAILIDPLGVILAVVLFEFLILQHNGILKTLVLFGGRFFVGIAFGWIAGAFMVACLSKRWLLLAEGEDLGGLFVISLTLLAYGISEFVLPESGLVATTIAGIYFGNRKFPFQYQIDRFKDQVVLFALSILFVLLASNIPVQRASEIPREGISLIFVMVFIIRPLSVFLSTWNDKSLIFREKIFLSFMAPRGIVSASLASLFAIEFEARTLTDRGIFLPLAFYVISGTIIFYAVASEIMARLTKVKEGPQRGVLIIGANPLGLLIAEGLRSADVSVKLIDSNSELCEMARRKGYEVFEGSGFDLEFLESLDLKGIGKMLAVTPNHEVNVLSCQTASKYLGRDQVYRLWDKGDNWESVFSSHHDLSWGQPIYLPKEFQGGKLWDFVRENRFSFKSQNLESTTNVSEYITVDETRRISLFAVKEKEVSFFLPRTTFFQGSELFYLEF